MKEKLSKGVILSLAGGDLYCKQFQLSALLWATSKGGGGCSVGGKRCSFISPLLGVPVYLYTVLFISAVHLILCCFFFSGETVQKAAQREVQRHSFTRRSCQIWSFGVAQGDKLWAVPFQLFGPAPPTPHNPSSPLYSSLLPPPSLLPSLSIDVGSHTCHLSLLIMHGRCCWCGLSHWDWEQQEWQHYAAE